MEDNAATKNNLKPVVYATIGAFDGIHVGHQQLIRSMVQQAQTDQVETLVITFHPTPIVFLKSIPMPFYITSPEEKGDLLRGLGVNHILTFEFNQSLSSLSPEAFIDLVLNQYDVQQFWLGNDFALGKNRAGDITKLKEIGQLKGFDIINFPHIMGNGGKISSSEIRKKIIAGDFPEVTKALNRYYSMEGAVIHGDARGKTLGIPTANLQIWEGKLLPASGVYATWILINKTFYPSVTNVGMRPTFESQPTSPRVEVLILNFNEDIYENHVQLYFIENIRPEIKFSTVDSLLAQIEKDKRRAEEILKNVTKPSNLFA